MMWLLLNMCVGLVVAVAGRTAEAPELQHVVRTYILSHIDTTVASVDVEFRSLPTRVINIPEGGGLRVVHTPYKRLRGNVILPVEVFSPLRVEHTFLVSVRVREYRRALRATAQVEKGTAAERIAVSTDRIESTNSSGEVLTSPAQLGGFRTKRVITAGTVITRDMLEPVPLVNQGSLVKLIVRAGSVVITTSAVVKEDGCAGAIVLVQKKGTGERLKARVVDEETVELLTSN